MEKKNNSYNLVIGVAALIVIILVIANIGYIVSKPKPLVIQGEERCDGPEQQGK